MYRTLQNEWKCCNRIIEIRDDCGSRRGPVEKKRPSETNRISCPIELCGKQRRWEMDKTTTDRFLRRVVLSCAHHSYKVDCRKRILANPRNNCVRHESGEWPCRVSLISFSKSIVSVPQHQRNKEEKKKWFKVKFALTKTLLSDVRLYYYSVKPTYFRTHHSIRISVFPYVAAVRRIYTLCLVFLFFTVFGVRAWHNTISLKCALRVYCCAAGADGWPRASNACILYTFLQ